MRDLDHSWTGPWLLPGETVMWSGRPSAVRRPNADLVMVAYLAVGGPLFFGLMVMQFLRLRHAEPAFAILVLAIAVLGLGQCAVMLYGLLVRKPRAARERRYALTDRRLLVGSARPDLPSESWYRDQLTPPQFRLRPDGTADVLLSLPSPRIQEFRTNIFSRAARPEAAMLSGIADPASFNAALAAPLPAAPRNPGPATPQHVSDAVVWIPLPGERVLWSGRPAKVPWWFGSAELSQTLVAGIFPLFIAGMAVVARAIGAPPFFLVPCAVLFAGGCYASFGRVLWRRARIRRSTYIVTDRRVICVWDLRGPAMTEAIHQSLLPPQIRPDGSVFFRRSGPAPARFNGWPLLLHPAALDEPPNFIGLADPKQVASIAAQARAAVVFG